MLDQLVIKPVLPASNAPDTTTLQEAHPDVHHEIDECGVGNRENCSFMLPPQSISDAGKLTVVLDLDETLVHAEPREGENSSLSTEDVLGTMTVKSNDSLLLVRKRPYLEDFLREAAKRFELIVFTAGSQDYADPVLNELDPEGTIFRHRLYRQHCAYKCGKNYVKDLRILNREASRVVLVDNNPYSFLFQLSNGIPIATFTEDATDKALVNLFDFLVGLAQDSDVRTTLRQLFGLEGMFSKLPELTLTPAARCTNMMQNKSLLSIQ